MFSFHKRSLSFLWTSLGILSKFSLYFPSVPVRVLRSNLEIFPNCPFSFHYRGSFLNFREYFPLKFPESFTFKLSKIFSEPVEKFFSELSWKYFLCFSESFPWTFLEDFPQSTSNEPRRKFFFWSSTKVLSGYFSLISVKIIPSLPKKFRFS